MGKKIVFYLKGANRAVTMTDHKEKRSLKELQTLFSSALKQRKTIGFVTSTDCLILKPSEIGGIHIQDLAVNNEAVDIDNSWINMLDDDLPNYTVKNSKDRSSENSDEIEKCISEDVETEADLIEKDEELDIDIDNFLEENCKQKPSQKEDIDGISEMLEDSMNAIDEKEFKDEVVDVKKTDPAERVLTVKPSSIVLEKTENVKPIQKPPIIIENNEPDISTLYTNPNSVPRMGQSQSHIFNDETGKPIAKPKNNNKRDLFNKVQAKASKSGVIVKPIALEKK